MSDKELSRLILSLNAKQRKIFNIVQDWIRKKLNMKISNNRVNPLRLAITGGVAVGKCHLGKSISSYLIKTFSFHSDKPKILSLAAASLAVINSDVTIFNTDLSINPNTPSVFGKSSRYSKIKIAM